MIKSSYRWFKFYVFVCVCLCVCENIFDVRYIVNNRYIYIYFFFFLWRVIVSRRQLLCFKSRLNSEIIKGNSCERFVFCLSNIINIFYISLFRKLAFFLAQVCY